MTVFIKIKGKIGSSFSSLQGKANAKLKKNYTFKEAESFGRIKTESADEMHFRIYTFEYLLTN